MTINIDQYKEKSLTRVLRYLRKNTIEKVFVTAEEIATNLSLTKSQISNCLGFLEHHGLLKVKMLNYKHRTDPRKGYKLNQRGLLFVEQREFRALSDDEVTLLNLYHKIMRSKNSKLQWIFLNLIQLFFEYGFNHKVGTLIEMMTYSHKEIKKFFRQENKYALNLELSESA